MRQLGVTANTNIERTELQSTRAKSPRAPQEASPSPGPRGTDRR